MTKKYELIEDMVIMRMSICWYVNLVSCYSCLWEYRIASLPESTSIRERYHKAELEQTSGIIVIEPLQCV